MYVYSTFNSFNGPIYRDASHHTIKKIEATRFFQVRTIQYAEHAIYTFSQEGGRLFTSVWRVRVRVSEWF